MARCTPGCASEQLWQGPFSCSVPVSTRFLSDVTVRGVSHHWPTSHIQLENTPVPLWFPYRTCTTEILSEPKEHSLWFLMFSLNCFKHFPVQKGCEDMTWKIVEEPLILRSKLITLTAFQRTSRTKTSNLNPSKTSCLPHPSGSLIHHFLFHIVLKKGQNRS